MAVSRWRLLVCATVSITVAGLLPATMAPTAAAPSPPGPGGPPPPPPAPWPNSAGWDYDDLTLRYQAGFGAQNTLVITRDRSHIIFDDTTKITPGEGCSYVVGSSDLTLVRCIATAFAGEIQWMSIDLGNLNDRLDVYASFYSYTGVSAGSGNDIVRFWNTSGLAWAYGGSGDDDLGNRSDDTVQLHGESGSDTCSGPPNLTLLDDTCEIKYLTP